MDWLTLPAANNTMLPVELNSSMSLIRLLGGLKDSISDLSTKSAIQILDDLLNNPVDSTDPIVLAIASVSGSSIEDVLKDWGKLQTRYNGSHSVKLRSLASSFKELHAETNSFPELIDWKLFDGDYDSTSTSSSTFQFGLNTVAKATISIEANAKLPEWSDAAMPISAGKAVCRIGMMGILEIDGKLGFSAGVVTAGASSSISGQTELDIYFVEEFDTHFGTAVSQNMKDLLSVVSMTDHNTSGLVNVVNLNELFHSKDMSCLTISADSTLMFGAEVGFAKTFNVGEKIRVKAGVDARATIIETGMFEYKFAAEVSNGEKAIAVQVKRKSGSEKTSGTSLGIEVDPRDYFKSIQPMIEEHFQTVEKALEDFPEFLPKSDFLQNELRDLVEKHINNSDLNQLAMSLVGIDSTSTPQEILRDRLVGVIGTSVAGWSEDVSEAVPGVVNDIQSGLTKLSPYFPDLKDELELLVKDALEQKQKLLVDKVTAVVTDGQKFSDISDKLKQAGATVSKNITKLAEQQEAIVTAINGLLDNVQIKINSLRKALQTATEKKLSLKLSSEQKKTKEQSLNLLFHIYPERDLEVAQEALTSILSGEMKTVFELINKHKADESPAVVGINGGYQTYVSLSEKDSMELVLWNFRLGTKDIFDADVRLDVNIDGSIIVQSSAEYKSTYEGLGQKRVLSFVESTEMLFAKQKKTFNIGITLSHQDEKLELDDVSDFFDGLIRRNLISQQVTEKAIEKLSGAAGRNAVKGRLDVGLTLSGEQLNKILESVEVIPDNNESEADEIKLITCPDSAGLKGCHWVLDTVASIVADVVNEQHSEQSFIKRLNRTLKILEMDDIENGIQLLLPDKLDSYAFDGYRDNEESFDYYADEFDLQTDLSFLESRRKGAMALYEILARIKWLSEIGENIDLSVSDVKDVEGLSVSKLRDYQFRIAKILPEWWHWSEEWKNLTFLSGEMRSLNVAFFESWVALAKGPDQEGDAPKLWASITFDDADGQDSILLT